MIVFVYGTLMRGGRYHHLLRGRAFLGEAVTAPRYQLLDLGPYPGLVEGRRAVRGELYRIEPEVLVELDALEEHPTYYRRTELWLDDGRPVVGYVLVDADERRRGRPIDRWQN